MEFILNKKEFENIENGVFLYSIGGGFGNIAKIVGKKIIKTFNAKIVGRIITDFFPDFIRIGKNGLVSDNISYKLYKAKVGNYDFIILYGDFQISILEDPGFSLYLRYKFMNKLFRKMYPYNIKEYAILGGLGIANQLESEDPRYMFAFNKYYDQNKIKQKLGEINIFRSENIIGMSGLMLYYSQLFKKPAFLLLVETYLSNQINGYFASAKALEVLSKIYDFQIDVSDLREKGNKLKEELQRDINKIRELEEKRRKEEQRREYYFG
jgi:predicted ATP-grasp superfamily ATP-dependent carboligase